MRLGGAQRSAGWWRCRCPVHGSHGPTLALRDGDRALSVKCWAGCDPRDVLAELRRLGLLDDGAAATARTPDRAEIERRRAAEERDRRRRIAEALDFWQHATDPVRPRSPVERYWLARGLALPIPPTIRSSCSWLRHPSGGSRPAMIGLVEHVEHGPVAIHRTWLQLDGQAKASLDPPRMSLGPVGGGAIRLAQVDPERELIVAEGIETTASVMLATGLPGWAALSAGGIEALILPPEARNVLIAADNDVNGTGERAAYAAGRRWFAEGRIVRIVKPPEPGTDCNDVLMGRASARVAEVRHVAA